MNRARRLTILPAVLLFAASPAVSTQPRFDEPATAHPDRTPPRLPQEPAPAGAPSDAERPRSPRELKLMRGDIFMARKLYSDAITVYQELLREEPRNAELLNKIGVAYHQQSRLGDARKYYKRALKVDKDFSAAINNLGMVNYDRRKYGSAAKDFRKALKINPHMPAVERNLGHAYFADKKYDLALSAFQRALALDPQVFERRGSSTGSILQGIALSERPMYFFFLAKAFAVANDPQHCAEFLRKAIDEGFTELAQVQTDPAFAGVREHPLVQEALRAGQPVASNPPPKRP
jgi:tetratricopeptide (TPR) repeat protein